jgi:WD40 repeat protein/class 3 adenylate cyclase
VSESKTSRGARAAAKTEIRTFLIADVRGYTRFTRERGDAEAARLAQAFANLARDAVGARSGHVIELRGDEALAVFTSPAQAVRAATELVALCAEEVAVRPELPLLVGVGIDAGEAVPVEGGFRGAALNMAARLCSQASSGQVLVTAGLTDRVGEVSGVRFEERGTAELKGFESPVTLIEAVAEEPTRADDVAPPSGEALPPELEIDFPIAGREQELSWLRGTWRQARRGHGRIVFVSGPPGIGKTRLASELAGFALAHGGAVAHAGGGGAAAAVAVSALRTALADPRATLLVLDDLDPVAESVATFVVEVFDEIESGGTMVVGLVRDPDAVPALTALVERADAVGDGHRRLGALDTEDVREIAGLYAGAAVAEAPVESIARASRGVPALVHELMAEWAEEEAARRMAAAAEWLAAERRDYRAGLEFANNVIGLKLARLYGPDAELVESPVVACPYKGLASFEEPDARFFFGREKLVGEIAARMVGAGLLGVVGASGSGKSSVLAAGVIPSLQAGLLPGSERWRPLVIRPGEHPLGELKAALDDGAGDEARLVLVVDQFEEVFTTCQDEHERAAFVDRLVELAADAESAVVLLGVRGDFYGHCGAYPELSRLLASNHVLVGPMTADELRRAVELPVRRVGVRVESALVDSLVGEIGDEPGGLPLLSTALVELWTARAGGWLRFEEHARLGGVRGAVARLAESSHDQLDEEQRAAAHRLFMRLVVTGEEGAAVRRRVHVSELDLQRDEVMDSVVRRLTEDRLLTASEGTVELAHEALLREWPRLQDWLREDAQGRELREHLVQSAKRWEATQRDPAELYRGARLSATLDWSVGKEHELNELEREFLGAGRAENERELTRQRRQNRRLKFLLAGIAVLLLAAVAAGFLALVSRNDARDSATAATAQRLGAQALVEKDLDRSLLLAREGIALDDSTETRGNLLAALVRSPAAIGVMRPLPGRLLGISANPKRDVIIVGNNEGASAIVDPAHHRVLAQLVGGPVQISTDGRTAMVFGGEKIALVDAVTGEPKQKLDWPEEPEAFFPSADLSVLAIVTQRGERLTFWDLDRKKAIRRLSPPLGQTFLDVSFAPDGRHFLTVNVSGRLPSPEQPPSRVQLAWWAPNASRPELSVPADGPAPAFGVSPDSGSLALGSRDGSVTVYDLASGAHRDLHGRHNAAVVGVGFAPGGKTLVTTSDDTNVIAWDLRSGEILETLRGHNGRVFGPAFSSDSSTLYTVSLDGSLIAWDLSGERRLGRPLTAGIGNQLGPQNPVDDAPSFDLSPDGRWLAVTQADGTVVIRDAESLALREELRAAKRGAVLDVAFSPDGRLLAAGGVAGQVTLWATKTWQRVNGPLAGPGRGLPEGGREAIRTVAFSPDSSVVAAGSESVVLANASVPPDFDGRIFLWDALTGTPRGLPIEAEGGIFDMAFSPDGSLLAGDYNALDFDAKPETKQFGGWAAVWSLDDRTEQYRVDVDSGYGRAAAVSFSPDGRLLVTGGGSGDVRFFDARTGESRGRSVRASAGWVLSLDFAQSGKTITTGASDGTVRLVDATKRAQIGASLPGLDSIPGNAAFTPDGKRLYVVYSTGRGFRWEVEPSVWQKQACAIAGRNLTREEWEQFLPDRSYDPSCPTP